MCTSIFNSVVDTILDDGAVGASDGYLSCGAMSTAGKSRTSCFVMLS